MITVIDHGRKWEEVSSGVGPICKTMYLRVNNYLFWGAYKPDGVSVDGCVVVDVVGTSVVVVVVVASVVVVVTVVGNGVVVVVTGAFVGIKPANRMKLIST